MSGRISIAAASLLGLLLASCASAPPFSDVEPVEVRSATAGSHAVRPRPVPTAVRAGIRPGIEKRVFALANRARRAGRLPGLLMRGDLVRVAREHALDMARRGYFSHYTPEGSGPGERASRAGVAYTVLAENLARVRNARDPAALSVRGWLASPGHRRNLLDTGHAGYRYTGVGVAETERGTILISQVFLR